MTHEERIYNQVAFALCDEIRSSYLDGSLSVSGYTALSLDTIVEGILLEEVEEDNITVSRKYKILMNLRSMNIIDFIGNQPLDQFGNYEVIVIDREYLENMYRWLWYTVSPVGDTPRIVYFTISKSISIIPIFYI